jgi:tRNA(Ile)-lysidine synthase
MNLPERFQKVLETLSASSKINSCVIAFSGGIDSHVLLYLCAQANNPEISFRAIHINHGLQKEADSWSQHCKKVCEALDVPFLDIHVEIKSGQGESPEEAARKARYEALNAEIKTGECLLTAHHMGDQSETLLLQLFRGAGPAGLASMSAVRDAGGVLHARPMLEFTRAEIQSYALENKLNWIEDPSNEDIDLDRNLIRQKILPLIKERWQQVDVSLSQVAAQQQHMLEIIEDMARIDLASIVTEQPGVISIIDLNILSEARQLNVLRYWIREYGETGPTGKVLHQVIESVLTAAADAEPIVRWGRSEIRRYRNGLYLLPLIENNELKNTLWDPREKLVLEKNGIELTAGFEKQQGLRMELLDRKLEVRFRQGGEKIRPVGRKNKHSVKKLMQDAGIPPWERNRVPMIYDNDDLLCVCGYWLADDFVVDKGEMGWIPVCNLIK